MSPFIFVIFGATGDLAKNKLIPALYSLYKSKAIPQEFFIIGFSRRELKDKEYREFLSMEVNIEDSEVWGNFLKHVFYQQGDFAEVTGYEELIRKLTLFDAEIGACITRIFYLATPPDNYPVILSHLKQSGLDRGCGPYLEKELEDEADVAKWTRIAIEKPFGRDLESSKALDRLLAEIFHEEQIFRVDHYLGKETVQNMIAFRFANGIFEPVWNKDFIDHVQITFAEKKGIGTRGKFFDGVGILRDVTQNHLLQLVAAVAMEQPKSFSREGVRDARVEAIKAIRHVAPEKMGEMVVRAQYEGYLSERAVSPESKTETFMAIKLFVDTERFMEVPFYLRAGKKMPNNVVEIKVVFKQTCHLLFKEYGCPEIGNVLTIRIQPDEGIRLRVVAKKPGAKLELGTVEMKFSYAEEFGGGGTDAYEKLLLDIFAKDQMLFNRSDELEYSWGFITDILKGWEDLPLYHYDPEQAGPKAAEDLLLKDGKSWL